MRRDDLFPRKYISHVDLKKRPRVVEIEQALIELLKNQKGETQQKVVLGFKGAKKSLPLNLTNFDAVALIAGTDETNEWPGTKLELYPTTTPMGGKIVDCVRIRRPQEGLPASPPPPKPAADPDPNEEIPW